MAMSNDEIYSPNRARSRPPFGGAQAHGKVIDQDGREIPEAVLHPRSGGFRFESTTVKEYADDYPKEYELSPRDILLVMTCQTSGGEILGIPGRIPDDGNTYLHNQRMGKVVIKEPKRIDPDFVYYLALWSDFNRELCVSASGTKILHSLLAKGKGSL